MAEIFLAKRQGYSGFEKVVALKKILPHYSEKPAFAEMLIHEAKLAAKLQHLNVVQVLDLGAVESQVYIAMEYVHGRDLSSVLSSNHRRQEKLPVEISLCIAIEFLTGLDYAHRLQDSHGKPMGLIHRDISPQNILLSYEGEVKVTDFGIARAFSPEASFVLPGSMHGKFGYMSPEQIRKKEIDQRADIFSAGVVLHELLTGKRLYRGKSPQDSAKLILNKSVPAPSSMNPKVPENVDHILVKALHSDRDQRYQTVGSLLGDLARCARQLPRNASRRDLAVYMRRQFGSSAPRPRSSEPARPKSTQIPRLSLVSNFSATSGDRTPVGDILIARQVLSVSQLDIALAQQRARGGRIGEILIEMDTITERDLAAALSEQIGIPLLEPTALLKEEPAADIFKTFPLEAAHSMCVFAMSINNDTNSAIIAVADPFDERTLLETKVILGVNTLTINLSTRSEIRTAISNWYDQVEDDSHDSNDLPVGANIDATSQPSCVLIADSDDEMREALAERIREEECEVLVAENGKVARDLCRKQKIVVAFIETNLPSIDGYNILLELRSKSPETTIFMTSNRADEFHQAKAMDLGADDFLVKPLNIEITTAKLRREIQKRDQGVALPAPRSTSFAGVSGSLEDMTFVDVIQSIEIARKTAVVVVQYDDGRAGEIALTKGKVRRVDGGNLKHEEAFYELAKSGAGLFRIEYRSSERPANIEHNNTELLLEALRRIDESAVIPDAAIVSPNHDWSAPEKTPNLGKNQTHLSKDDKPRPQSNTPVFEGEIERGLIDDLVLSQPPPADLEKIEEDEATDELSVNQAKLSAAADVDDSNVFVWAPIIGSVSTLVPAPKEKTPQPALNLDILDPEEEITELPPEVEPFEEDATEMAFDVGALQQNLKAETKPETLSGLPSIDPEFLFDGIDPPFKDFENNDSNKAPLIVEEELEPANGEDQTKPLPRPATDVFGDKRPDREGPAQPKPPKHFSSPESDVFALPALPGQETPPVVAERKPLPLPLNALTECEPAVNRSSEFPASRSKSSSNEGQSLARVALQKVAAPRKDSKFGGAAIEKVAVKHVDHSRQGIDDEAKRAHDTVPQVPIVPMDDAESSE